MSAQVPGGELRLCYEPFIQDGVNWMLAIGRGDLAFAPLPAASDPLLLQWFSVDADEWAGGGAVAPDLLNPSRMHSLLELSRMQKARRAASSAPRSSCVPHPLSTLVSTPVFLHPSPPSSAAPSPSRPSPPAPTAQAHEALLRERELYGLPSVGPPYEARDNELGVALELLLYGATGKYGPISRRLSRDAISRAEHNKAARMLQAKSRSRSAQKYVSQERAAIIMQAGYYRWRAHKVAVRRKEKAAAAFAMGLAPEKPEYQTRAGLERREKARAAELLQKWYRWKFKRSIRHTREKPKPKLGFAGLAVEAHAQEIGESEETVDAATRIQARIRGRM